MSSIYHRMMPLQTLAGTGISPTDDVFDAGAYNTLQLQGRVLTTGTGTMYLQHAAVNEPGAFVDLANASWNLNGSTAQLVSITNFLRFLRWATTSASGSPVAVIDLIGKQ